MLQAVPKGWFSSKYDVSNDNVPVGTINFSAWREEGELTIGGSIYRVYREGLMSGSFVLELNGSILARAQKPSALYRTFIIELGEKKYVLEAKSAFSSKFMLIEGERQIGSAYREGVLARKSLADFPDEIEITIRMFLLWLVMILWRRSDSASAG